MPVTINVGFSEKLGQPEFGSIGTAVTSSASSMHQYWKTLMHSEPKPVSFTPPARLQPRRSWPDIEQAQALRRRTAPSLRMGLGDRLPMAARLITEPRSVSWTSSSNWPGRLHKSVSAGSNR